MYLIKVVGISTVSKNYFNIFNINLMFSSGFVENIQKLTGLKKEKETT